MAVPPSTLAHVLERHARERPQAVALAFGDECLTYRELAVQVARTAAQLAQEWGVKAGDRVAWLGANHPRQLVLLFALARIGAILLPLNWRLAPAEWDVLVADCTPSQLVHDDAWEAQARDLARRHGLALQGAGALDAQQAGIVQEGGFDDAATPSSPVLLVYTSGTTARPKAAVHTQANLLANMAIASQVQEMTPDDIVATVLPMFHVGGLCIQTLPALLAGARVILQPRFAPDATLDCFERERPTLTLQVPATLKALVEHPRWANADLSSLRAVWAGSSVIAPSLIAPFHARGIPVCNVYGSTETGPFSIALPPRHAMSHVGSCGWPAPGVEAKLDAVNDGVGELLLRGPNIVERYWPELPARDAQGWFHTGDLASQAADASFTIVGRAKDLIISGGENIHPAEIEFALAEHEGVLECAAFALGDPQWGEVVAVAIVRRPGSEVDEAALREHLASRIARYKLPRRWLWVDALPKTALGKVQRAQLQQLASSQA